MPVFVCTTAAGRLSPTQKAEIAETITAIYHEVIGAPRYLVQVFFSSIEPGSHFIAGSPAPTEQILIRCDTRSGKTSEQRSQMAEKIMQQTSKASGAAEEDVTVLLCELPAANIVEYGRPSPVAGEEDAWFSSLSKTVQERFKSLS